MPKETIQFKALGTDIEIQLIWAGENQERARADLAELETVYRGYEKIFSRFDKESELSRLNSRLGVFHPASQPLIELAQQALNYYDLTGGLYDPRVITVLEQIGYRQDFHSTNFQELVVPKELPRLTKGLAEDLKIENGKLYLAERIDLAGLAKGYITDQVAQRLGEQGWKNVLVNSGGDIRVMGVEENRPWSISLEGFPADKFVCKLTTPYQGIATSGVSRRKWENKGKKYHHIIHPQKPHEFIFDIKSVTVLERTALEADLWAKTLFLMGKREGLGYAEKKGLRCLFLDRIGNVSISSGIKEYII